MKRKPYLAADLFCGAGGTSTGLTRYAESVGRGVELVAVNHWERAVETHALNHPGARHHREDLSTMDPVKAVPGGKLDILFASPECTHHSNARGGKPKSDQSRASAWCVLRWLNALRVDRVVIENVPEFLTWGPLGADGRPLKSRKGETFRAFVAAIAASGYSVEWRVLNSADYGAATSRKRLFVQAVRGRRKVRWPAPTHARHASPDLFGNLSPWRGAREVIDWSLPGESIFGRKRPLSANTLRRIEVGLRKFGGAAAAPFLVALHHMANADGDGRGCRPLDAPVPTVLSGGTHIGLAEPFLVPTFNGEREGQTPRTHSVGSPLPTVVACRPAHAVVEPILLSAGGPEVDAFPVGRPLNAVLTRPHMAVAEPFIVPHRQFDEMSADSIDRPVRTITATNGHLHAVCEPFMVSYYGTGEAHPVSDPMRTITTRERFGLVQPDGSRLDIRFRMLQPHELSAAMGFPAGYKIAGNKADQVRQIGNAVEVHQAEALAAAALGEGGAP